MRILAVDDDPTIRDLVRTTLACAGYGDLVTAPNALAAMAEIARAPEPFDCFLLDIQMPGTDGIELCRQIRRIGAHRDAPILMITGVTDHDAIESALEAGATDYVNKPFDPTELVVRIGVAERMCEHAAQVRASLEELEQLRSHVPSPGRPGLDAAFEIPGVSTLVGAVEMENYLLRMPRLQAWRSRSYTLRVEDVERIHAALSGEDFQDLMAEVGDAIAASLKPWPHVITYAGAGTFAAVVHGPYKPRPEALLAEVQDRVATAGLAARVAIRAEGAVAGLSLSVDGATPVGALLASLSQRSQAVRP